MTRAYSGEAPWRRSRIVVPVDEPAAGADWSLTVPAGHLYHLVAVYGILTTDANVANRRPFLGFTDGQVTYLTIPPVAAIAASTTEYLNWTEHGDAYNSAPCQMMGLPELTLEPGWTIAPTTVNVQVGDQWSSVALLVIDTMIRDGSIDIGGIPGLLVEVVGGTAS